MGDVEILAEVLKNRFSHAVIRHDYGWPDSTALCVLDCVLSLNRRYDSVVFPRVQAFAAAHPHVTELSHLHEIICLYQEIGQFSREKLNYNDAGREQTLRGVIAYMLEAQANHAGETERARLQAWARAARPADYKSVGVKGFGLAGFQYMRMLFDVQTTKPDVHIIRFVSEAIGHPVNDITALSLLEQAALKVNLPLREVDGEIWEAGARGTGRIAVPVIVPPISSNAALPAPPSSNTAVPVTLIPATSKAPVSAQPDSFAWWKFWLWKR